MKEIKAYFEDIIFSIEQIEIHLKNINTFSEFKESQTVIDAVERRIFIIGEAIWKASKMNNSLAIPNKEKIIGLRHILTHDYDLVSKEIIWKIVEKDIPILKQEVSKLLVD